MTKAWKGSFTIEAALLMTIILPVLVALLLAGFYVHDKGKLQGIACEAAARGGCLRLEKSRQEKLEGLAAGLSQNNLLWGKDPTATVSAGKDYAHATIHASFHIPGLIGLVWDYTGGKITGRCERSWLQPASLIRKLRGARHLTQLLS